MIKKSMDWVRENPHVAPTILIVSLLIPMLGQFLYMFSIPVPVVMSHGDKSDNENIELLISSLAKGFETGNVEALSQLFHQDVVVFEFDLETYGWVDFRDNHLKQEIETQEMLTYGFDIIKMNIRNDVAWVQTDYFYEGLNQDQSSFQYSGLASLVLVRENSEWKIIQLHMS